MFKMILQAKEWKHEEGCKSARIVLLGIVRGELGNRECVDAYEFSTHMQISNDQQEPYFAYGHYFGSNIHRALNDYDAREV